MKKVLLISIPLIFLGFFNCTNNSCFEICKNKKFKNKIQGKWQSANNVQIEFTDSSYYFLRFNAVNIFEQGYYKFENNSDSIFIYLYDQDQESDFILALVVEFIENQLILAYYKGKQSSSQIDEIDVYKKVDSTDKTKIKSPDDKISKFIFPNNYIGSVFIAFNQPLAQEKEFDKKGNRIIRISENGLLETQFKEDLLSFALNKNKFYYNKDNKQIKEIPCITFNLRREIRKNKLEYDLDSIYVLIRGYNQLARGAVNDYFGKKISGQILMYKIDTLKNLIADKGIIY